MKKDCDICYVGGYCVVLSYFKIKCNMEKVEQKKVNFMLYDVNDLQLVILCSFYKCQFDPAQGGEMTQLEFHNILMSETAL